MTATVLGVLQVLFSLSRAGQSPSVAGVARLTGQSTSDVDGAVKKLGRWKLVNPESLRPTLNGELTVTKLRESNPQQMPVRPRSSRRGSGRAA